mmetsp:Transcript_43855/g.81900  ORF Transcript_43855/g.81900 Transcript_43855/m.81900 type:complete len:202 (-) Transcript_43855:47-652(-)
MARTKSEALKASQATGKGHKKTGKSKEKKKQAAVDTAQLVSDAAGSDSANDKAKQEIRFYQANTELLVPKVPFQRLVRELCSKMGPYRFEVQALLALQEAAEMFLTGLMEDASLFCLHGRRVTVMKKDLQLSRRIRSCSDEGSASSRFEAEGSDGKGDKEKEVLADSKSQAVVTKDVAQGQPQADTAITETETLPLPPLGN